MSHALMISVIVPTYNRTEPLLRALHSILEQSRPADEIIVVDDGSEEDVAAVLAPLGDQITLIRQDNAGVAAARNTGVAVARGTWLTFLDSDDIWLPERLAVLERDLAGCGDEVAAHIGNVVYTGAGYEEDLFGIKQLSFPQDRAEQVADPLPLVIAGMTLQGAAVRRTAFAAAGGFDTSMRMMSDTAFFCQLALVGPFLMSGVMMSEIIRLEGDTTSITSLRRTKRLYAAQMKNQYLEALLPHPLSPAQTQLVRKQLSGALFKTAEVLHESDKRGARQLLWRSARGHPEPLKGWIKALLACVLGARGYNSVAVQPKVLDRS